MTFTISIPALSAEQVEYLGGVGPATVSATLRGIPARAVWFSSDKVLWSLMAQPQMKTLADLRQKPIGITGGLGATGHVALLLALEKPDRIPRPLRSPFTGVSDMIQALESGYLSAAMLQPPQLFYAMSKGFKEMLNVASMIEMPVGGLTTLVKTIQNRPARSASGDQVGAAGETANAEMRKKETLGLIMKVGKTDREAALKTYDTLRDALAGDGRPTRAGIENILKALVLQGRLPNANVPFEEIADSQNSNGSGKRAGVQKCNETTLNFGFSIFEIEEISEQKVISVALCALLYALGVFCAAAQQTARKSRG